MYKVHNSHACIHLYICLTHILPFPPPIGKTANQSHISIYSRFAYTHIFIADPKIKEDVQNYLDQNNHHYSDCDSSSQSRSYSTSPHLSSPQLHHTNNTSRPSRIPTIIRSPVHMSSKHSAKSGQSEPRVPRISQIPKANGNSSSHSVVTNNCAPPASQPNEPTMKKKCGFEAYMMTGDLILNLSRTQQTSGITTHSKKVL